MYGSILQDFLKKARGREKNFSAAQHGARPYAGRNHRTQARIENRSGRAYSPPLRENPRRVRRGGLYDRPKTPAIPTAPSPNAVGRHAHMPPGPGRDDCRPGEPGGAAWAHIQCAPTAGNGSKRVCRGGLYIRPGKPAIPTAPPSNGVGRHAHMPPGPGRDDCRPGEPGGAAWAHIQCAPTAGNGSKRVCRGGLYIRPGKPAIPTAPRPTA